MKKRIFIIDELYVVLFCTVHCIICRKLQYTVTGELILNWSGMTYIRFCSLFLMTFLLRYKIAVP